MKAMKIYLPVMVILVVSILLLSGCTSMTMVQTIPSGAKVYVNDELGGETPYALSDQKIIGAATAIRIEKSGYKPLTTWIVKTEEVDPGPVICGFVFTPVWWLWAMKYKPVHSYELVPLEQ